MLEIEYIVDKFWELNPHIKRDKSFYERHNIDREETLKYQREWRGANHEAFLAISRRSKSKPKSKDLASIRKHKRRALELGCDGSHTIKEWRYKLELYNHRCAYCNRKLYDNGNNHINQLTKDHIIPLAEGGTNDIGNIVPACRKCNMSKHKSLKWLGTKGPRIPLMV